MPNDEDAGGDWLFRGTSDAGDVAARYDEWAASYDADLQSWAYQPPAVVADTVVDSRPDAGTVLDVGCGTGLIGRALRDRGYAGRLVGFDISSSSLQLAQRSGTYDALVEADLQQPLVVASDDADVLVCVGVMTYLPAVEAVWREFARVVRPGGLVVVTQREDLWEPRRCDEVIRTLAAEGVWSPVEIRGPAPYLPHASGSLAEIGVYYLISEVR